jgi:hypothetical protein
MFKIEGMFCKIRSNVKTMFKRRKQIEIWNCEEENIILPFRSSLRNPNQEMNLYISEDYDTSSISSIWSIEDTCLDMHEEL